MTGEAVTEDVYITKGTRVVFNFLRAEPVCLSGAQMKLGATLMAGEGVIRNVWSDDPEGQVRLRFNVELDDGSFVVVPKGGVSAVIEVSGGK